MAMAGFIFKFKTVVTRNKLCVYILSFSPSPTPLPQGDTGQWSLRPVSDYIGIQAHHLPAPHTPYTPNSSSVEWDKGWIRRTAQHSGQRQDSRMFREQTRNRNHTEYWTCACWRDWRCFVEDSPESDDGSCHGRAFPHSATPHHCLATCFCQVKTDTSCSVYTHTHTKRRHC